MEIIVHKLDPPILVKTEKIAKNEIKLTVKIPA